MECQVRTAAGAVSAWVGQGQAPYALGNHSISAKWQAVLAPSVTNGVTAGWRHEAADPATGATTDVTGTFTAPTEAKEFRVYRRVNESAQSLVTQGEVFALPITWRDTAQINCCGEVEYALQTFDTHGNPSPLVPQGEPITVAASLPVPMLEPLTFVGPLENAGMRIAFFSSSDCVERFEIWVARKSGQIASSEGSIGLSGDIASHPNFHAATGPTAGLDFAIFSTGVARHLNADGAPQYDFVIPVSITDTYTVTVRAVGKGTPSERALGAFSNIETKSFGLGDGAELPWPDRPLPSTVGEFHPGITATYLDVNDLAPWKGNAVRIGEYSDPAFGGATTAIPSGTQPPGVLYQISGSRAPIFHLYTNDAIALAEPKETIPGLVLPVALYRVQVANTTFPIVPGDIVQVSPLLEQIAYKPRGANGITVTDPFVAALFEADTDLPHTAPEFDHDILLLDRQPVIKGARYKYLLVRFSPGREIDRVIVTNTVDVPLTP